MVELQLVDDAFGHQEYSVPGAKSKYIKWNRNITSYETPIVFSQGYLIHPDRVKFKRKFGLIIESRAIVPHIYSVIPRIIHEYELFFTHSSELLQYPNARWTHPSGSWINGQVDEKYSVGSTGEPNIYPKSKLCSIVSSDKMFCPLHMYRIQLAEMITALKLPIDVFGTLNGKWVPIIHSLKDYMFSIAIENFIDEEYFTEKIINCFMTGTVPIYLGATNIGKHFDTNGIIQINQNTDIVGLLESLTPELYQSKIEAIKHNFEAAKKYRLPEDYIYENYLKDVLKA